MKTKIYYTILLVYCCTMFFSGCEVDSETTITNLPENTPVTEEKYTISGTITIPDTAPGVNYKVFLQDEINDITCIYTLKGKCQSSNTINYSINNISKGSYYIYVLFDNDNSGMISPTIDDYVGYFGADYPELPKEKTLIDKNMTIPITAFKKTVSYNYQVTGSVTLPQSAPGKKYKISIQDELDIHAATSIFSITGDCNNTSTINFNVPDVKRGPYYIIAIIDNDSTGFDEPTVNDYVGYYSATFPAIPTQKIYIKNNINLAITAYSKSTSTSVILQNVGNNISGKNLYLIFEESNQIQKSYLVGNISIANGSYHTVINANVPVGTYYVWAFVDTDNDMVEDNDEWKGYYNVASSTGSTNFCKPDAPNVTISGTGDQTIGSANSNDLLMLFNIAINPK